MAEPAKDQIQVAPEARPKLWKKLLALVVVAIAVFFGLVAMQPSEFRVQRSVSIQAPADTVFAHVNNFHKWQEWSPWAKKDPTATNTFEGPEEGVGAIFKWEGNQEVGEGQMTLKTSQPPEKIGIQLDFIKPYEDTANVEFTFQPHGDHTDVKWTIEGRNNFVGRIFCMFMNMDKMIGDDFDKGLASLKAIAEAKP